MNDDAFIRKQKLFSAYELSLSKGQYAQLESFLEMLIDENQRQNLTRIKEHEEIWVRHFLDSAVLSHELKGGERVLDLGSGGGFPTIPLAILRPDLSFTMLEAERRKAEFTQRACENLGLSVPTICARAEEAAREVAYRASFDAVISRAMANGSVLTELAVPFLKTGGRLYALKGRSYDSGTEGFQRVAEKIGARLLEEREYTLEGEKKHLIIIQKIKDTDSRYPRKFAKIKRQPL